MKVTSNGFKALAEDEYGVRYYHKITLNGIEIADDINNFQYSHTCNGENTLTIGNVGSAMVEFSINQPSVNLTNEEIEVFEGIDVNGTIEYVKIGIFKVLKPTNDRGNVTYQCVDRMTYLMNMPFFSELTSNITDVAILNEICTQVGITLANTDLISHTLQSAPIGYTRREVISYMSQLQGKNAIINDEGNLELIWYSQTDYVVDDDKIYYEGTDSINGEVDYTLEYIECIVRKEEEEVNLKSGNGIVGISFENPFMTQEILDEVFAKIGGFIYRPVEVQFLGDFRLEVGDIVTVTTNNSSYIVPIMEITHDSDGGVKTTIQSIAETESENGLDLSSPSTKAMDRYYANLVLINKALVNKLDVDQLDAVAAEIQRLVVNEIDGKYAKIDFANIDTAKVDTNIVSLLLAEVGLIDRATIVEGHVTKLLDAVEINANSIKSGTIVTDRLLLSGAEGSILFELNNLGELTSTNVDSLDGYVITPRTINADRIVAGSITANEIDVQNLFAQDITATGTIRGAKLIGGNLKSENFVMQGSDVVSGMEIDLENGYIWSPNVKILNDKMEIKKITELSMLNSKSYEYLHDTYGTIKRDFSFNIEQNINSIIYLRDSIVSDNEFLGYTMIGSGYLNIGNKDSDGSLTYDKNGLSLQDTLTVTGATTLESTLNVKGTASFDKPLNLSSDGIAMTMNGVSGNILNYSSTNNAYYLLGTENISNYVVGIGNVNATKEIQMRARVKFYTETYSSFIFNNGSNTYFLLSYDNGEDFNNLRPLTIQNATGYITAIGAFATDLKPSATDTYNLGTSTSLRFNNIYAKTSTIASSDENAKKDIEEVNDKYNKLYDKLTPVSYRFKDGARVHIGFISQRVQEAMNEVGLTDMDFAGFCKDKIQEEVVTKEAVYDENGNMLEDVVTEMVDVLDENDNVQYTYGLRYEEFIALNTHQIQKLKTRVNALEEENRELKETINNVLLRLQVLEERG